MPPIPSMSIASAVDAGFKTTVFVDRKQSLLREKVEYVDWREVGLPWSPDEVTIEGREVPYFAGFANLFRYKLLSQFPGWWFDCDTFILRSADDFVSLLPERGLLVGMQTEHSVNNAVLGGKEGSQARVLYEHAEPHFPNFSGWGETGPRLLTKLVQDDQIDVKRVAPQYFYPVPPKEYFKLYMPEHRDAFLQHQKDWFCVTLWGEMLRRSGLAYLGFPEGSYLHELSKQNPSWGTHATDLDKLSRHLLDVAQSDELRTLKKKAIVAERALQRERKVAERLRTQKWSRLGKRLGLFRD